jgi:hypothetical protein
MKLNETIPFEYQVVEGTKSNPEVLLSLEGIFQRADTKNANQRVYPHSIWKKVESDPDIQERIQKRRMVGMLEHPANGATSAAGVSHVITEHKFLPNGEVRGRLDVLNTPMGQIAATLVKAGVGLGISSRGDGSVEKKGDCYEVQSDYRLETYDLVLKPSTPGAYPTIAESEDSDRHVMIAEAVKSLVESTDALDVLLECHKIVSALDESEASKSVISQIKSKLEHNRKNRENETNTEQKESEEEEMTIKADDHKPTALNLTPEMEGLMREWVANKVAESISGKDEEISKLNSKVVEAISERDDLVKRLDAAEQLIEAFDYKVRELKENATTDQELQERFDASTALLDEAMDKLQDLGNSKRELAAAKSLLATAIAKQRESVVDRYKQEKLEGIPESVRESVASLIEDCQSPSSVDKQLAAVSQMIESAALPQVRQREPLPTTNTNITERSNEQKRHGDMITSRLLNKIQGM